MSRKSTFTSSEDAKLIKIISNLGNLSAGSRIAASRLRKNPHTIKSRYILLVSKGKAPKIRNLARFTDADDKYISLCVQQSPGNLMFAFKNAAKKLDRTTISIRQRYYCKLSKTVDLVKVSSSLVSYNGKNKLNTHTGPSTMHPGMDKLFDAVINAYPPLDIAKLVSQIKTGSDRISFLLDTSKV